MSESTEILQALLASRRAKKLEAPFPADFHAAAATACAWLTSGGADVDAQLAFDALAARNRELCNNPAAVAEALAMQSQLLERVHLRYLARAEAATTPDHRHLAMRTALAAQRQLVATLAALYQINHAQ